MTGNEVAHAGSHTHTDVAHAEHHAAEHHEEVTSPDQHRRTVSPGWARLGAIITIIALPLMAFVGNHQGNIEKIFLTGVAGLILLWMIIDFVLRKTGLRS